MGLAVIYRPAPSRLGDWQPSGTVTQQELVRAVVVRSASGRLTTVRHGPADYVPEI